MPLGAAKVVATVWFSVHGAARTLHVIIAMTTRWLSVWPAFSAFLMFRWA